MLIYRNRGAGVEGNGPIFNPALVFIFSPSVVYYA